MIVENYEKPMENPWKNGGKLTEFAPSVAQGIEATEEEWEHRQSMRAKADGTNASFKVLAVPPVGVLPCVMGLAMVTSKIAHL